MPIERSHERRIRALGYVSEYMWEDPRWLVLVKNQRQTQPIGHLEALYQISVRRTVCVQNRRLLVRIIDTPYGFGQTGRAVKARLLLLCAVALIAVAACTPVSVTPPATSAARATAAPTPTPTVARPSPTTAPPTPSPSATLGPSPSPGATPVACPTQSGGSTAFQAQITAVRAAHNPGFDRVVFEFGPSSVGTYGLPPWTLAVATEFVGTSGRQVPVDGNAFLSVRLSNASTVDPTTGKQTFTQTDLRPGLPLVREVKLIDDFERVMTWGLGLERLACAKVSQLAGPIRLVVDLPTPP